MVKTVLIFLFHIKLQTRRNPNASSAGTVVARLILVEIVVTLESVYLMMNTHVQQMKNVNASMCEDNILVRQKKYQKAFCNAIR